MFNTRKADVVSGPRGRDSVTQYCYKYKAGHVIIFLKITFCSVTLAIDMYYEM